jgi:hypothetical protein
MKSAQFDVANVFQKESARHLFGKSLLCAGETDFGQGNVLFQMQNLEPGSQ